MESNILETGALIREYRKKKGLTQGELGKKIGVTASAIMRYELGQRGINLETVQAIAAALDVDPYSLMSFDMASDAISEEINNAVQYKATVVEIMEKITTEGLRIGKEVFEAIAGNPKYQQYSGPIPCDDELEQTDTTPPLSTPEPASEDG